MKQYLTTLFMACGLMFSLTQTSLAAPETYKLDPEHTYVLWHINHLGFSSQSGKWMAEGTLVLDQEKPENSQVNATIRVGNLITGNDALNEHLAGKLFFNIAEFPLATFVSNKVDVTGKDTAKVHGLLTLRGVAKPIVLDVKFNKAGINPISNKMSVGFSATADLNRSDFGMSALVPNLGDNVALAIEAEAYQEQPTAESAKK